VTNDEVIGKIRKLLNLADPARGGTEAERDTAMQKAQELMFKHDLELFEIGENDSHATHVTHTVINVDGKTTQWQGMLLFYLSTPLNCQVVYVKTYVKNQTKWTVVGTPDNIKAVQVLWEALVPWLKSQASLARRLAMPSNPAAFNRAFFDRAGRVIGARLKEQRDYLEHAHTRGTDLVVARDAQNAAYMRSMYPNARESRRRGFSNSQGIEHGHMAGHRADLTPNKLGH
jgi:hypothetical protein